MEHNRKCELSKEACKALYNNVLRAVDGELSQQEEAALLSTIQAHPCCFDKMSLEKSYKDFICSRLQRKTVPLELIATIKSKVQQLAAQG